MVCELLSEQYVSFRDIIFSYHTKLAILAFFFCLNQSDKLSVTSILTQNIIIDPAFNLFSLEDVQKYQRFQLFLLRENSSYYMICLFVS